MQAQRQGFPVQDRYQSTTHLPTPIGIIKFMQKEAFYITIGNQGRVPSTYQMCAEEIPDLMVGQTHLKVSEKN